MVNKSQKLYASLLATSLVTAGVVAPVAAETEEITVTAEVTNNVGKKDTVLVKAVPANATVKIYLAEDDTVPAFSKKQGTKAGDITATLAYDLPALGTDATEGTIYVTITAADATAEGTRTAVTYNAEPQTAALTADDVEVLNNVTKKDAVQITLADVKAKTDTTTDIRVGAKVYVYAAGEAEGEKGALLGSGSIAEKKGDNSITTVSLKEKLTEPSAENGGKLIVTVANPGQAESEDLPVTYSPEAKSITTNATVTVENNVTKKDGVVVKGLAVDKVATVNVYKADPSAVTGDDEAAKAKAKAALLIGSAKSKAVVVPAEDPDTEDTKDGQAAITLKTKNGFADIFEEIDADSKVYVTVQYAEEHESDAINAAVVEEVKTDVTDVTVASTNNLKGKDLVTFTGAEVGAEIIVYDPTGVKPLGKAKVKEAEEEDAPTETIVSIAKGFSADKYEDGADEAKYLYTIQNPNELVSDETEFTAANVEQTTFTATVGTNVIVENNVTKKDTLKVTGLADKTTVNVYSESIEGLTEAEKKKLLIGKGTAKLAKDAEEGATAETTITITKGFANTTEEGLVVLEVAEPNKLATVTDVEIAAETPSEVAAGAQITVSNGLKKDTVTVSGLAEKDIVKVYSELNEDGTPNEKKLLGKTTVKDTSKAVTISLKKAFATKDEAATEAETFYVTVQNDNKAPVFATATAENKEEVALTKSDDATGIAVPVEDTTAETELEFTATKITAKSFGFDITSTTDAGPLAAKDTVKFYLTNDEDAKPVKTVKVSDAHLKAGKVPVSFNIDLSDNEAVEFFYTVTKDDEHESKKVSEAEAAHFAKTTTPTAEASDTTAKGETTITVEAEAAGDVVKVYSGSKVVKTVKAVEVEGAFVATVKLTGIKKATKYDVTLTTVNKDESEATSVDVAAPAEQTEQTEPTE